MTVLRKFCLILQVAHLTFYVFVLFCFALFFFFLSSCCWVFLDHFIPSGGFETILRSWFSNIIDLISTVSWASLVEITPAEHRQSYTPHAYGKLMKQEPPQEYKTPRQSKLKAHNNLLNELQKSCTPVITSWNDQNIGNWFIYLFFFSPQFSIFFLWGRPGPAEKNQERRAFGPFATLMAIMNNYTKLMVPKRTVTLTAAFMSVWSDFIGVFHIWTSCRAKHCDYNC